MERVLITGATGFVGACLTENLVSEGYQINVVARKNSYKWRLQKVINQINVIDIDLCDESAVNQMIKKIRPEIIFHLATYGGYFFQQEIDKIVGTNIIGTINLVNACSKIDYKCFINTGSSSEYGIKNDKMKEIDILEPINTYGVTKSTATLYCQMIAKTQKRPIVTARLFSPYGYYEDKSRLVSSTILACLLRKNPQLASGDAVRDFIFIEDVISLLKTISKASNIGGKIYNIGSGEQHSVAQMVDMIIKESGAKVSPQWGAMPGRKSDTFKWEADMSLVKKELNWEPRFSLQVGIRKTIAWFEKNIGLYEGNNEQNRN